MLLGEQQFIKGKAGNGQMMTKLPSDMLCDFICKCRRLVEKIMTWSVQGFWLKPKWFTCDLRSFCFEVAINSNTHALNVETYQNVWVFLDWIILLSCLGYWIFHHFLRNLSKHVSVLILEIIRFSPTVLYFNFPCELSFELYIKFHFFVLIICKPICRY